MRENKLILDPDEALRLLDKLRNDLDELRRFIADGVVTEPPASDYRRREEKESTGLPFELRDFNIDAIAWKTKDSSPAGPNEAWAWAFSTDREGFILDEVLDLLNACEQYGEIRVGSFLVKIGGRDNNLLNRRWVKK